VLLLNQALRALQGPATVGVLLLSSACARPRDTCERVARRLMPTPEPTFIEQCVARFDDPGLRKAADCILAVKGEVYDEDVVRCGVREHLPLYFHF
jgi:hypothetical protein